MNFSRLCSLGFVLLIGCGGNDADSDSDTDAGLADEPVTEENFLAKFAARFCGDLSECNPDSPCYETEIQAGNDTSCTFDPASADACLSAAWPCLSTLETPRLDIPHVCEEVWDCG